MATDATYEAVRGLLTVCDSADARVNVLEVLRRGHSSSCLLLPGVSADYMLIS